MINYITDCPKDQTLNKQWRLHILQEADNDPVLQQLLKLKCQEDILFLVNVFGWTYDPRKEPSQLPFITYPFQDDTLLKLVSCIELEKDVFIEKSRDMGASWMMVALQVYGFINGWPSLYGSYKEDYVDSNGDMDSHFERIRFFISMMPDWLLPKDIVSTYMSISSREMNCSISGDAGANFGTGGRRKFVIGDEFALWQADKKAFRKTKDIARCRIFLGTPEGKYNVYGQVMTKTGEYANLNIVRIRLHWTLHPEKTMEWYEKEKATRTPLDVAKELDISYEDSVTGAVYPEFNQRVIIQRLEFNPKLPLFTARDFGRDMNVVLWIQKDYMTGALYVIDSYQAPNKDIEFVEGLVYGKPMIEESTGEPYVYDDEEMRMMDRHKDWVFAYALHTGDPYNSDSTTTNAPSSIKRKLATLGTHLKVKRDSTLEERIRKTHQVLPRVYVDSGQLEFIQAMTQSRYPEATMNATREKTKPIHDVYSHMRTAFEYFVDNEPMVDPYDVKKRPILKERTSGLGYNPLTGENI